MCYVFHINHHWAGASPSLSALPRDASATFFEDGAIVSIGFIRMESGEALYSASIHRCELQSNKSHPSWENGLAVTNEPSTETSFLEMYPKLAETLRPQSKR